jgi:uncharacterized protein YcbX
MIKVVEIWRHPIKSHGREPLDHVAVTAGQTLPLDRAWAVAHEKSDTDGSEWASYINFSRGAKAPLLMAINATWNDQNHLMTLTHPSKEPLTFDPDQHGDKLIEWTKGMVPENRAQSTRLVRAQKTGMTDTDYPSISIGNMATHRAIEQKHGRPLSNLRWRCNIWVDGAAPWEEFEWVGKSIQIGGVVFKIEAPVTRCLATTANPQTGMRDADTLGTLDTWDHQEMTVYGVASTSGPISIGDELQVM